MKKQAYQKPAMRVVKIQHQQHLLAGSIENVNSNAGIGYGGGGGGSGPARSRGFDGWDDDEE